MISNFYELKGLNWNLTMYWFYAKCYSYFQIKMNSYQVLFWLNFRLWDAVGGFLFLFAHMQEKLSRNSSQVDLLQELLNLQKDLVTMLLSMLEGMIF